MAEMVDVPGDVISATLWGSYVDSGVRFFSNYRPRKRRDTLALVADQAGYTRPDDFLSLIEVEWGASRRRYSTSTHPAPWSADFATVDLPRFREMDDKIYLDPAPTSTQIGSYGTEYAYWYKGAHEVTDEATTIPAYDDPIVKLFAKWCAYRDLAVQPGQPEEFVVRYRKMAEQVWERIEALLKPAPAIVR